MLKSFAAPINLTYSKVPPKIESLYEIKPFKLPHYNTILKRNLTWFEFIELSWELKLQYIGWLLSKKYIKYRCIPIDMPSDKVIYKRIDIVDQKIFALINDILCNYRDVRGIWPTHVLIGKDYYEKLYIESPDWYHMVTIQSQGNFIADGIRQFFNLEVIFNPHMEGIAVFHLKENSL